MFYLLLALVLIEASIDNATGFPPRQEQRAHALEAKLITTTVDLRVNTLYQRGLSSYFSGFKLATCAHVLSILNDNHFGHINNHYAFTNNCYLLWTPEPVC